MAEPVRIDSLALIEAACWRELKAAGGDRQHAWHTMALATLDGDRPAARTVVLRDANAAARRLVFFTDSRSPKLAQLRQQPLATLLLWSPRLAWQLRAQVRCEVHVDGLEVTSRWARLKLSPAAQDYLSPLPPGAQLEHWEIERGSREHFAVVVAQVTELDWLELHAQGPRRARFTAGGTTGATWLAP